MWYNELGSILELAVQGASVVGRFTTRVGDADGCYPLVGVVCTGNDERRTLGFAVGWENQLTQVDCVTVWCGEFIRDAQGTEMIVAIWLMTEGATEADEWSATRTGKDIFRREAPPTAAIAGAAKRAPHPGSGGDAH